MRLQRGRGHILWDGKTAGTYREQEGVVLVSIKDAEVARAWQRLCRMARERLAMLAGHAGRRRVSVDVSYPPARIVLEWSRDLHKLGATWRKWRLTDHIDYDHGADPDGRCSMPTDGADRISYEAFCRRRDLA